MRLWLDTETYSEIDISCGSYRYAERARLLLIAYAIDDSPAVCIDVERGEPIPAELDAALNDPLVELWAHNSNFDRQIVSQRWIAAGDPRRWRDTMVLARAASLPGALADLCECLRVPQDKAKDADGKRLIKVYCVPNGLPERLEDREHFREYCRLDVEAMREVYRRLPKYNEKIQLWREFALDQRINDRGMAVDVDFAVKAIHAADAARQVSNLRMGSMTSGEVQTANQRDALLKYIRARYGLDLADARKSTLEKYADDETLSPSLRDLIRERLLSAKTSVQKYQAIVRRTNSDGRLRGCLGFMAASRTGRWTGQGFQPQNIPRGSLKPTEVENAIAEIKAGLAAKYPDINSVLSSCLRGVIIAPRGRRLVDADLSNIEGRTLAWLAGETWKLKAFRDFDAGRGHDLYKLAYSRTFGIAPEDVKKPQRQIGKVLELAMGYQGGVGAFVNFATIYRVDLKELAKLTRAAIAPELWDEAEGSYDYFLDRGLPATQLLDKETFIACDAIKRGWRKAHPAIVQFWRDCERGCQAMLGAIPGVNLERVKFRRDGNYGLVRLPSGRIMHYPVVKESERGTFSYFGINQVTKKPGRIDSYGGKVVENITQAVARDVLVSAMPAIEADGFGIVLSVHDELITECPDTPYYTAARLAAHMATTPSWAQGLPLAAAGFEAYRYKKD